MTFIEITRKQARKRYKGGQTVFLCPQGEDPESSYKTMAANIVYGKVNFRRLTKLYKDTYLSVKFYK